MFYSQDGQDKYLETYVFKGFKNGIFVDVGAHDGIKINNTLYFEKNRNWTGVNIEPNEEVYKNLIQNRPLCININCAISNENGSAEFILNSGYTEMLSGLKHHYDERHHERLTYENSLTGSTTKIITVPTKKLQTIFDENNISSVNYLSIDVEGGEFEVIKSIDFNKMFIDVIGFENNYEDKSRPIVSYLEAHNYIVIHKSMDIFMIHKKSIFNTIKHEAFDGGREAATACDG
jgi:FkbM family methyltransferase